VALIFDVEDTGIGIAPEDQARIFDPFVQLGHTRSNKGVGLGLAICRDFVQILSGSIHVESTPGQGSRFHVEVPAQRVDPAEVMVDTPGLEHVIGLDPDQPDYRILIVEDQRENWLVLERLLTAAGFQVRVAEDGALAVETFEAWRPHFIWMDLRMPVLSGWDAAERIRQIEGGREVKIVAVTASVFASQREEVLASGFDDLLRKPYRPEEVFDCMSRHLGVGYVYAAQSKPVAENLASPLRPQDLSAIPEALRNDLEEAVISLDRTRIALVIGQISAQVPALGSVLSRLADSLTFTPILNAIETLKSGLARC
jgi:CheY-like chemotaxis protein